MKRNPRLGALENLSVVGLVAGSIASLVSKQILYTTMPMSLLVILDLLSRRRFEDNSRRRDLSLAETDQKLAIQVDLLNQHISTLPSVETMNGLRQGLLMKDREVARRLYAEITALQQELNQRLHPLEHQGLDSVRQEITQLEAQHQQVVADLAAMGVDLRQTQAAIDPAFTEAAIAQLQSDVSGVQASLDNLTSQNKPNFSSLQEQISRIDRQFGKLPPPVDLSSLKQEVGELVRMISDLVPRRDLLSLVKEVRELHQQQEWLKQSVVAIETAAVSNSTFGNLMQPSGAAGVAAESEARVAAGSNITHPILSGQIDRDIAQRQIFQSSANPDDATVQEEAAHYLEHLRSQFAEIQSFTETLATQNQRLQEQMNQLPKSIDMAALQSQLRELSQRIPAAETTLDEFRGRIQAVVQQELHYISQQLQISQELQAAEPSYQPNYELVYDWAQANKTDEVGGYTLLEEALNCTQKRLILILPWASPCNLDQAMLQKMAAFLQQGRRLDIGWCNGVDRQDDRLLKKMQRGWQPSSPHDDIQTTLHHLLNFKRTYPQNFQFKILGTRESFLVSDQSFAILGIMDALKTTTALSEAQLKLRTRDPQALQRLINRFDNPTLDPKDWEAYWNRGATRQNLGDKIGAIADYTQVLEAAPEYASPYSHRGIAYYDVGDLSSAIADLTEAIRLDPQQAATYCNRAFIRSEQGNLQVAIADYTQAIQIRPDWAIAFFYRGMVWQKLERHQDAISDYGEAIYLAPDSAVACYYRGLAWQKLRNTQGAIADLEKAAVLFNQYGSLQNAQKALKSLAKLRQINQRISYPASTETEEAIVCSEKTALEKTVLEKTAEAARPATRETVASDLEAIASLFQGIPAEPQVNGCDSTGNSAVTPAPLTFQDLFGAENLDLEKPDLEKLNAPSPLAS